MLVFDNLRQAEKRNMAVCLCFGNYLIFKTGFSNMIAEESRTTKEKKQGHFEKSP